MISRMTAPLAASALFLSMSWMSAAVGAPARPANPSAAAVAMLLRPHEGAPAARSVRPVAQSCKDKCLDEQDRCINSCPADPNEAVVCRGECSDKLEACQKGC